MVSLSRRNSGRYVSARRIDLPQKKRVPDSGSGRIVTRRSKRRRQFGGAGAELGVRRRSAQR